MFIRNKEITSNRGFFFIPDNLEIASAARSAASH